MPGAANNGFDPEDFAKLMASFDTGNPSEAEATNAGRMLRRSLASNGLGLVDVMGRADVMQALEVRLQPVREESPQLKEAFAKITQLRMRWRVNGKSRPTCARSYPLARLREAA
jgi:hypothetical protein